MPTEAVRLVDGFDTGSLSGGSLGQHETPRTVWEFEEDAQGRQAGPGVADLTVRDGALRGRTTGKAALLHVERTSEVAPDDPVHSIEVRRRAARMSRGVAAVLHVAGFCEPGARWGVEWPLWVWP